MGRAPQTPEIVVVTSTPAPPEATPVAEATEPEVVEATPTVEIAVASGAVSTLQDVQQATIRIQAQGNFVDPAGEETSVAGTGSGFIIDPEGIALRPGSNQLFIAFDQGAAIAAFTYTPTLPDGHDLPPAADCVMF